VRSTRLILGGAFIVVIATLFALPTLEPVIGCLRSAVWPRSLIALHTAADGVTALAYAWLPVTLVRVWRHRKDIPASFTLLCFAGFIVSCGLTHVMSIITIWNPLYWLAGEIKAATAILSLITAWLLSTRVAPLLIAAPSAENLRIVQEQADKDAALAEESRQRAEELEQRTRELEAALDRVRTQELAIRELSTPVLEVYPGVLLVPLIGTLDSQRAAQFLDIVAEHASTRKAEAIILDLTGVPVVDTAVANLLIKASGVMRLLGARCIATGIRPAVANTMIELGIEIDKAMETKGALSQGLALALGERAEHSSGARPRTRR